MHLILCLGYYLMMTYLQVLITPNLTLIITGVSVLGSLFMTYLEQASHIPSDVVKDVQKNTLYPTIEVLSWRQDIM